ncbi:MAG: RagB/SusD family nutrient uptake outer membrane protein [Prevotellaceae bacterium]|jgi:hypothetical protein|nr:RagB/SusD family nutrient uptake outer membrane protein [Prevotellaceae bacterium]
MKKIVKYFLIAALMFPVASCEDFLDTENFTQKNTGNFPLTETDAEQMIAGIYNNLQSGVMDGIVQGSFFMASELASDDRLGGGGSNDRELQAMDLIMQSRVDQYSAFWSVRYTGINRANSAIENLDKCEMPEAKKQKMLGEAYFLRAFYYYELASMFENVPLHLTTKPEPLPQASPDETWGQIIADLKTAIELMPDQKTPDAEAGHVDKYVAEAMMARAFLFYTGFYGKTEVALPDGGAVTKQMVINWIDDCINNSGYSLVMSDYRNLWSYTNKYTVEYYDYTKGQGLKWVEDDNAVNPESMLAIKFNKNAGYACNRYFVFCGLRNTQGNTAAFPFGNGWGAGPVATNLWNDWDDADIRKRASICDIAAEIPGVDAANRDGWVQDTRYFYKKGSIVGTADGTTLSDPFDQLMYGFTPTQWDYALVHDQILIRFADVLLMQSELKEEATGMNLVRARAGLPPVAYSLENIQRERRFELAFEGVRWNDMRRWGATYAKAALARQDKLPVYNKGVADVNKDGTAYQQRYDATRGFFAIPNDQIILSDGLYKQNDGWDNSALYAGW